MDCYDACSHGECGSCLEAVLAEVATERDRQDKKWGGPEHDDKHSTEEFLKFIGEESFHAASAASVFKNRQAARMRLIRIAALAVAAVQSISRSTSTTDPEDTLP